MVGSIIKTVQMSVLAVAVNDPTVATVNMERWLYVETYLVIITSSIPCLRSLLRPRNRGMTGYSGSYELSMHQPDRRDPPILIGVEGRPNGNSDDDDLDNIPSNTSGLKIEKQVHIAVY